MIYNIIILSGSSEWLCNMKASCVCADSKYGDQSWDDNAPILIDGALLLLFLNLSTRSNFD